MDFEKIGFKWVEVGRRVTEKKHTLEAGNSKGQNTCHRGTKSRGGS